MRMSGSHGGGGDDDSPNRVSSEKSFLNPSSVQVFEDSGSEISEEQWLSQVPSDDTMDSALADLLPSEESTSSIQNSYSLPETKSWASQEGGFRQARRPNPFAMIVPVDISKDTPLPAREASSRDLIVREEEEQERGPSFREFALLSSIKLSQLDDETVFCDDGPCHLDPFLLDTVDFLDVYPKEASADTINQKALSRFCFPDGLRVRVIPRVALPGAMKKGWAGVAGDKCHILVFTDESGKTQHGVAITVRQEVTLTMNEKKQLSRTVKSRLVRRMAANRIARWWKRRIQDRILTRALVISGFENHTVEHLRAELTASELRLLEQTVKSGGGADGTNNDKAASGIFQWQMKSPGINKKIMKALNMKKTRELPPPSPGGSTVCSEVESLTRSAIQRGTNHATDGDCASELTDDTDLADGLIRVDASERMFTRMFRRPSGRSSSRKRVSPKQPVHKRSDSQQLEVNEELSDISWKRGLESHQAMRHDAKFGYACIVEKCYVLIGCRPGEHVLLLGPLQQLVNAEREEINKYHEKVNGLSIDEVAAGEKMLLEDQLERRHAIIEAMLKNLRLTQRQSAVAFPRSNLEHLCGKKYFFETVLPISKATRIKLPLPLPSIGKQWALAKMLLDIGPDSLVLMLKLLLLERSILVLGENLEQVTSVACGLLELLEPFEWSSIFLPVLPHKMLDFCTSPVPFVAGMAVRDYTRVRQVENDARTLDAMSTGMSLLNLSTNTLHITSEPNISNMLSLDPYLRNQLRCLTRRLQHLTENNPSSSIHLFRRFIRNGVSTKESVTLDSCCMALEQHFSRYCGDLAVNCNAWKRYGTLDQATQKFIFYPDWFMNPVKADVAFQEAMVHTQLFMGYVDERRRDQAHVEEMKRGVVGKFIAEWVYERWLVWKKRNNPVEV